MRSEEKLLVSNDASTTPSVRGQWNSSITRVRPFFQALLRRDPTGNDWLSKLLSLSQGVPSIMANAPGTLLPWVADTRTYIDKVLNKEPYKIPSIELERCLEKSLPPPKAFLGWLISNAPVHVWKQKRLSRVSPSTKEWRDKLFGLKGVEEREKAIREAVKSLENYGSQGSERKWWAFEGFTEVDCYLETDRLILLVEGKRTEHLSKSTDWCRKRNQLLRNLEAISEAHGDKEFGVIVIAEAPVATPPRRVVDESLPHLKPQQRQALMQHFWGCVTWEQACKITGLDYSTLPTTTAEALKMR